mgnify:CR=1 FL=1
MPELQPRLFSFNNPFGACPDCTGIGEKMELPNEIKEAIEIEISKYKINELKTISENITSKYKDESGNNKRLVVSPEEVCTYAAVRMPATYSAVSKVIKSCIEIGRAHV